MFPSNSQLVPTEAGYTKWAHRPSSVTLTWLMVSIPTVIWDICYIFLRPASMPGGRLHSPIFLPYKIYGSVDYLYGWPAFTSHNGFPGAVAFLNILEIGFYLFYLMLVIRYGSAATETSSFSIVGSTPFSYGGPTLDGQTGALAALILLGTSLATFYKTLLYCQFILLIHPPYVFTRSLRIKLKHVQGATNGSPGSAALDIIICSA